MMPTIRPDRYLCTSNPATLDNCDRVDSTILEPFPYFAESK
jgi:hypothetical protein